MTGSPQCNFLVETTVSLWYYYGKGEFPTAALSRHLATEAACWSMVLPLPMIVCIGDYGPGVNGQSGWAKPQLTKPKTIYERGWRTKESLYTR